MFICRLANGRATETVGMETITPTRGLIATSIWKEALPSEVGHKVHWALPDEQTDTRETMDMSENDQVRFRDTGIHKDL